MTVPADRLSDAEIDEIRAAIERDLAELPPPVLPTCDCWEARSWRKYWAPEWIAYRQWLADYNHADRIRRASYNVSAAMFPRPRRGAPTEAQRVAAVLDEVTERWGEFEPASGQ